METPRYQLHCSGCDGSFSPEPVSYTCPRCGENLDVRLPYEELKSQISIADIRGSGLESIWRYTPLLPVRPPAGRTPLHAVGWTPVYELPEMADGLARSALYLKDESGNPTASFKDRASAVVAAHALANGLETVITASSGNAGAAMAGMAAAVGLRAVILVPANAPAAKVAQLLVFGASVILVDGTYDDAFDLSLEAAHAFGWYCRNTGYNPLTREGKKTAAFEIFEQVPDAFRKDSQPLDLFVSVGDGNIISGLHKGFLDLQRLGWLSTMPRIYGVQAAGSAAVANAFRAGVESIDTVDAATVADSISVGMPRDGLRALRAATETGGAYVKVSDGEILQAISDLGRIGVFAEPAGAASFAGLRAAVREGLIEPESRALVLNTGSGLKDIPAARSAVPAAKVIDPSLAALKRSLGLTRR